MSRQIRAAFVIIGLSLINIIMALFNAYPNEAFAGWIGTGTIVLAIGNGLLSFSDKWREVPAHE